LNLATSSRFPLPWQDEDVFADVAVNMATGQGFVSTVSRCGDNLGHFWACNAPLYPFMLGEWTRTFGFTIRAVRSLNYVLISLCVGVLWFAVRRLELIPHAPQRIVFATLLLTGYGMGFIYRSARYDCLGLLLFSLVLLSYSLRSRRIRILAIGLLGCLMPITGIQLILYSTLFCVVMIAFLRMRVLWEAVALETGVFAGSISLLALYQAHGVLSDFQRSAFGQLEARFQYASKDPSLLILLGVCFLLVIDRMWHREFRMISPLGAGLAFGVLVPAGMYVVAKFPIYYSWMAYVPLALVIGMVWDKPGIGVWRPILLLSTCGLLLAGLVGLPVQIASAAYYWNDRDCARIEVLDRNNLTADDWVYTEYAGYFAARKVTTHVFMPFRIPYKYRDKITVMIITPEDYQTFAHSIIGGDWQDTGAGIYDTGRDILPMRSAAVLLQRRIDLHIYRRVGAVQATATHRAIDISQVH
jgi:hypothetical protein